jgi:hypothetical protein
MMNPYTFSFDALVTSLVKAGYTFARDELDFAHDSGAFKYIGYDNDTHSHKYLVGFSNESDAGPSDHLVSIVYVSLGRTGELVGKHSPLPVFEGTEDQVMEYIEKQCN